MEETIKSILFFRKITLLKSRIVDMMLIEFFSFHSFYTAQYKNIRFPKRLMCHGRGNCIWLKCNL